MLKHTSTFYMSKEIRTKRKQDAKADNPKQILRQQTWPKCVPQAACGPLQLIFAALGPYLLLGKANRRSQLRQILAKQYTHLFSISIKKINF